MEQAGMQNAADDLLVVRELKKSFRMQDAHGKKTLLRAVDGVSFCVKRGETFGLVGESGCGKSTLGRTILQLRTPDSGEVFFDGKNVTHLKERDRKRFCREAQLIFQDPAACLNPRITIGGILDEPFAVHGLLSGAERRQRIESLLDMVGLAPDYVERYPHEMSGGQKQRIGIARALALGPKMIVCDEPVSALDVSIQAQVINLLMDLQKKLGLSYLFISHDLGVVYHICDRIAVMYLGRIVEMADKGAVYNETLHPYTQALISAVPGKDNAGSRIVLDGDVPDPHHPPEGCRFHTRCPQAMLICTEKEPSMQEIRPAHFVACHLYKNS